MDLAMEGAPPCEPETSEKVCSCVHGTRAGRVSMVGRLCQEKNYPFALELTAQLRQERPECMLVIAGNGPLRKELEDLVDAKGLRFNL